MEKRIFFAIPLSSKIQKEISDLRYQWLGLPIRWVIPKNLHITLLFIGPTKIEELGRMSNIIHDIAQDHGPFTLRFSEIALQPNIRQPNLLWLEGEDNKAFSALCQDLETTLRKENLYFQNFSKKRKIIPHITLGRIRKWQWQKLDPEERVDISESLSLKIPVNEISLVESKLHRQGPEYIILETAQLEKI